MDARPIAVSNMQMVMIWLMAEQLASSGSFRILPAMNEPAQKRFTPLSCVVDAPGCRTTARGLLFVNIGRRNVVEDAQLLISWPTLK